MGVVVFDVQNGQVVSSNTESRRIVCGICTPGRLIAQLLDALTVRRADRHEITPEEYLALVGLLRESRTVRTEEIILETPDGNNRAVSCQLERRDDRSLSEKGPAS